MTFSTSYDTIDENCYPSMNTNALLLLTRVGVKHDHLQKRVLFFDNFRIRNFGFLFPLSFCP